MHIKACGLIDFYTSTRILIRVYVLYQRLSLCVFCTQFNALVQNGTLWEFFSILWESAKAGLMIVRKSTPLRWSWKQVKAPIFLLIWLFSIANKVNICIEIRIEITASYITIKSLSDNTIFFHNISQLRLFIPGHERCGEEAATHWAVNFLLHNEAVEIFPFWPFKPPKSKSLLKTEVLVFNCLLLL